MENYRHVSCHHLHRRSGILLVIIRGIRIRARVASKSSGTKVVRALRKVLGDTTQKQEDPDTPRPISDLKDFYMDVIGRDFPNTNMEELISATEKMLCLTLNVIGRLSEKQTSQGVVIPQTAFRSELEGDENLGTVDLTDEFLMQIKRRIDLLARDNTVEHFDRIRVLTTGVHYYRKNAKTGLIVLQTAISYIHYRMRNGKLIFGSQDKTEQARYQVKLVCSLDDGQHPNQDTGVLSAGCMDIGAPLKGNGNDFSEFCKAEVITKNIRLWRISEFSES